MKRKKLKKLRETKNLTQKEVAKEIKISRPMYTNIENGTRNPSLNIFLGFSIFNKK